MRSPETAHSEEKKEERIKRKNGWLKNFHIKKNGSQTEDSVKQVKKNRKLEVNAFGEAKK